MSFRKKKKLILLGFLVIDEFFCLVWLGSKIEGSQATAKQTAELLRSVISQTRVPYTNQAGALIDSVKAVGERLIAANPVGMMFFLHWV